eukprot:SAG25_NODE_13045_length_272_cov_0.595376_1_plen_52_part_01
MDLMNSWALWMTLSRGVAPSDIPAGLAASDVPQLVLPLRRAPPRRRCEGALQ